MACDHRLYAYHPVSEDLPLKPHESPLNVSRIKERTVWIRKFMKHGTKIASLTPSSRWLCRAMCRDLDSSRPQTIVELGAGTGPLTEMVQRRMHPEGTFLSVEMDEELHALASRRCPDVDIARASVEFLPDILAERGIENIDVFMSCLPVPSIPHSINRIVLETWKRTTTNGVFTQITQIPWWFKPMYNRVFRDVRFQLVMMNPPPGGVYHCSNLYDDFVDPERLPGKDYGTNSRS